MYYIKQIQFTSPYVLQDQVTNEKRKSIYKRLPKSRMWLDLCLGAERLLILTPPSSSQSISNR